MNVILSQIARRTDCFYLATVQAVQTLLTLSPKSGSTKFLLLTIMPDIASAEIFLGTLNHCHPSAKFTMEVERNASLPFIGVELLNLAPRIKTKVYVKPTNTGLLLHYQSHVDNRYKRSLITTMLDRAYRISSDWSYFSQECSRLETVFLKLKYSRHLFNLAVKQFVDSRVADQQQIPSTDTTPAPIRVVIPFKDQVSAHNSEKTSHRPQLKN